MGKPKGKSSVSKVTQKQIRITETALPLLKKPLEQVGKQIGVPGAFWQGRVGEQEKAAVYLCTIREFDALHKWGAAGSPPCQAFQLQEMGTEGTGSLEHGDSSGEIFWMPYPNPFLGYYYKTFPDEMLQPKGADCSISSPTDAGEDHTHSSSDHRGLHPSFPSLRVGFTPPPVFKYFTINSDILIEAGKHSGSYNAHFQCVIERADSSVCGKERSVIHPRGKAVSTTNLINHLKECADNCPNHKAALDVVKAGSRNFIEISGEVLQKHTFTEAFTHHVDLMWLRTKGLSGTLIRTEEFQGFVRGYDTRAIFPDSRTLHRIAKAVHELQKEDRMQRIKELKLKYKGKPCIGLQLDMWTDSNSHTSFACITMTTVLEPTTKDAAREPVSHAQLYLRSEILDFDIFPNTEKTGENIKTWFLEKLAANEINHSIVSGITPDGAADGQCGLGLIDSLAEKVDTCLLHQLQRAVLFSVGLAGTTCKNPEAKSLLRKNNRVVMLSRQSLAVNKSIKEGQLKAGVPDHKVHTLMATATTRWGNQFLQLRRNNLLRMAIDPAVEKFKKENKGNKEAIVEPNESDQGSKVGKPVASTELGLNSDDWEANQELEGFLSYPYELKDTIEHKGYCTGAQGLMLLHDLKSNFCNSRAKLETLALPASLKMDDRVRVLEVKPPMELNTMIEQGRKVLQHELQARCFDARPSNARMVQLFMSKQMDVHGMLTNSQYSLAKTLYMQWLRHANEIHKVPTREGSPRKAQKVNSGAGSRLFRGAGLIDDDDSDNEGSQAACRPVSSDGFDPVTDEIGRWARLSPDSYSHFIGQDDSLLNEFALMWDVRERFPLHFTVFKQVACHLAHEANVEQVFSRAGNLSDPNMDPEFLAHLVTIAVNKKAFAPPVKAIKEKYFEMFRGTGGDVE